MISAPVFLLWDESVPTSESNRIRSSLGRIFSGVGSSNSFDVYLDLRCFSVDGQTLISLGPLKQYKPEILSRIRSIEPGNAISVPRLEIDEYINREFDPRQRSEMSRPFVIVVAGRPWANNFNSKQMVRDLLGLSSGPRLAVFDKSNQFDWTREIEDRDERKRVRVYQLTNDGISLDAQLKDFEEWFFTKISQAPSLHGTANPFLPTPATQGADTSVQSTSSVVVPKPIVAARPTISLNDVPAPAATPVPVADQRPAVDVNKVQEIPIIENKEPVEIREETTDSAPLGELPATKTEDQSESIVLPSQDPVAERGKYRSEKDADSKRSFLLRLLKRDSKTKTPTPDPIEGAVPEPVMDESDIQKPESLILEGVTNSPVVEPPLRAADGQIIIDKKSSLNSKPWHYPDWKALPSAGPSRDLEIEYGSVGELRVFAGSTRGTKHQYYGDENQDAFFIARTVEAEKKDSRFVVLVASDGVGSAAYSAFGSKSLSFLVGRKTASLLQDFEGSSSEVHDLIRLAIKEASDATQSWTANELYAPDKPPGEAPRDDVSATLSVAVVKTEKSESGMRDVWLACVGDSPCYSLNGGQWMLRSAVTKDGAVLEHGTQALPVSIGQEPLLETFTFEIHESELLMLVSDGIGTSMASGNTVVGRWMAQRLHATHRDELLQQMSPSELISTLTFDRQGEDDDRTMILLFDFDRYTNSVVAVTSETTSLRTNNQIPGVS